MRARERAAANGIMINEQRVSGGLDHPPTPPTHFQTRCHPPPSTRVSISSGGSGGGAPRPSTAAKETYPSIRRHWREAVRALNFCCVEGAASVSGGFRGGRKACLVGDERTDMDRRGGGVLLRGGVGGGVRRRLPFGLSGLAPACPQV